MALPPSAWTLVDSAIQPSTLLAYSRALSRFLAFLAGEGGLPRLPHEWDAWMAFYFETLWAAGLGRSSGDRILCAFLHFCPSLVCRFPLARRALTGWGRLCPSTSHRPVRWALVCGLALFACAAGDFASALAFLLSHDCYLRRSEVAGLRARHVVFDSSEGVVVLVLPRTKTGRNQSVCVRRVFLAEWLLWLVSVVPSPDCYLFPSARTLYASFSSACASLGVGHLGFVFHSLRHGGATDDYLRFGEHSVPSIQVRGRWRQTATLLRYLQQARAVLSCMSVPSEVLSLCSLVASDPSSHFSPYFRLHPGRA